MYDKNNNRSILLFLLLLSSLLFKFFYLITIVDNNNNNNNNILLSAEAFSGRTTILFNHYQRKKSPSNQQQQRQRMIFGGKKQYHNNNYYYHNNNLLLPLPLSKDGSNNNHNNEDDDEEGQQQQQIIITRDLLLREMLKGPDNCNGNINSTDIRIKKGNSKNNNNNNNNNNKQQTKNNKREYKVFDNRDTMPFAVQLQTPDPYTHPEIKRKNASKMKKRNNAIEETLISSKIMMTMNSNNSNDNISTLLGEYPLDKYTTTGDTLLINNVEYKVMKHRCQYKYVGGQRFVMVRKILEVKEIGRLQTEQYLYEQLRKS